jgi:hypothetical protein
MNPADVAPMVVGLTLIVVTGGVLVLRPLARRIGDYLEMLIASRRAEQNLPRDPRMQESLERIEERLRLVEERQDFTDAMLASGGARKILREAGNAEDRSGS